MKHSFPYLFPIKGGLRNDLIDGENRTVMPSWPDNIRTYDDRRAWAVNKQGGDIGIEIILVGLLILEIIRSPQWQESRPAAASDKLLEANPHLKNNRYYKAWRRRELLKNNPS